MPLRTDPRDVVSSDGKIRCVLVHDYVLLRQGLRRLLEDEPDIDVISEAVNAAECLRKVHQLRPDVVVADAETFGLPALEAQLRVARECPDTKIVFVSTQEDTASRINGLRIPTEECALRQTSAEELLEMVRNSYYGGRENGRETSLEYEGHSPASASFSQEEPSLTAREQEVLKLLAEGKTVRASAEILGVSVKTVDAHKFNLMRKLGVHNKAELVMRAIQKRVVKIPVNF